MVDLHWGNLSKIQCKGFIALATFIKTNQNPNSERRRFSPPLTIWVLCPNKNGDSYKKTKWLCHIELGVTKFSLISLLRSLESPQSWGQLFLKIYRLATANTHDYQYDPECSKELNLENANRDFEQIAKPARSHRL